MYGIKGGSVVVDHTKFSQKAFVDFAKIKHALLSDTDGKTLKAYGVYREELRIGSRAYFIVDKDGVVRFKNVPPSGNPKFLLSTEGLLEEIKKINKGS